MLVIRVSLCFLWSVRSTFGRRKHSMWVQPFSPVLLFPTPWTAHQAFLSISNTWVLFKFTSMELVMPFNHVIWLWLLGVWECAAGPLPCVPNYMHLECVSSLSWTLCCRIDWWDWVWLSQDMTHAEYAMVFAIGPLFIHSLMTNSMWFWLYIHFWFTPTPWLLWHMVFSRPKLQGLIPHQDQSTLGRENFGSVKDLYP
jgi:hypothetical protein